MNQLRRVALAPATLALLLAQPACPAPAERSAPVATPVESTIPEPRDLPYPGTIGVEIDATDVTRNLFRITERIPVAPGTARLTLLLPKWLPGHHAPGGMPAELADLRFTTGDKVLSWKRDPFDVFAFHVELPAGASEVTARFVHTAPILPAEGRVTMTAEMLNLQWDKMTLYPAGHYVRQIPVQASVSVPAGWQVFTALDGRQASGNRVQWAATDYETLVDSPIFAGLHAQRWDLGNGVALNAVADSPALLALRPEHLATYRALVNEALALYGSRHFDHYDFLVALSDRLGDIGLEHHRSSENQMAPTAWSDWANMDWERNVLPHELSHSWDGKFRRPAGLWTPDYRQPMRNDLLWVYEGQNQFWGYVLAARSGVQSKDVVLGMLASNAAAFVDSPGRAWRAVSDTTLDPIIAARKPKPYASLTRGEDYYTEGALIWLEADQLIRNGTRGRKGLDDFARGFFGMRDGDWGTLTYSFGDVVAGLNAVWRYDWASFLRERIDQPGRPAPLAGIEAGGYKLVWRETPNPFERGRAAELRSLPLAWSLGLTVDKDGRAAAVRWDGPAFRAGLVNGTRILAVNGKTYDQAALREAITAAKSAPAPIELVVQRGEQVRTVAIDYHGGLRYPWLERTGTWPTGLDVLLTARTGSGN